MSAEIPAADTETELHITLVTLGLAQAYFTLASKAVSETLTEAEIEQAEQDALKFIAETETKASSHLDVAAAIINATDTLRELFAYARVRRTRH